MLLKGKGRENEEGEKKFRDNRERGRKGAARPRAVQRVLLYSEFRGHCELGGICE